MTEPKTVSVQFSNTTVIHLTDLVDDVELEQLRTQLECESVPDWLSIPREESVTDYFNDRKSFSSKGSGNAGVTFCAERIGDAPAAFREAVVAIEQGDVNFKDVRMPASFEFPSREEATLLFRSTIDEDGDLSSLSIQLKYEDGDLGLEHVRTFENGDTVEDGLTLSHNEVVQNAQETMDWVYESDMRKTSQYADEEWLEFLWLVGVEGQVTDGRFENEAPPFDYTELLDSEGGTGRLMYYAYRYHGWDYSLDQLEADLEQLTEQRGDGSYLII